MRTLTNGTLSHYRNKLRYAFYAATLLTSGAYAQTTPGATRDTLPDSSLLKTHLMPQITVLGERAGVLNKVPGSATYLNLRELLRLAPISGNEVFRRVPGLHVVDEEGAGLRANIGIRGLDPDRSRGVLVLEDGVPVALNPYGEPEMYYTPSIDRMEGVEVLKGSGQILFGPQTIGGVINYLTADPPEKSSGSIRLRGGEGGFFTGLVGYGNTFGNTGVQVNYLRRQADRWGTASFRVNDLSAKIKFRTSERSSIGLKLGVYDEGSNSTYLGLTQPMYETGGQDYVRMAPDDRLDVRRYSASLTHEHRFSPNVKLRTTAFGYTTTRNWQRQDFSASPTASNQTGTVWGDPAVPGGAVYMRNSTGSRNRQFEVAGVEPRLSVDYYVGKLASKLEAGTRFLYERAFEQRVNGRKADARSGDLVEDEIRTGYAFSVYAQNKLFHTERFSITPGVRLESYQYERNILRNSFVINNASTVRDTNLVAGNDVWQLIPGIGFNYNLKENTTLFAGLHRGFAPPRVKDAVTNVGQALQLDAESSWNAEIGARTRPVEGIKLEMTGFLMDFSNQIIPVSESSGGTGSGLVNGGRTRHQGVEASVDADLAKLLTVPRYAFILNVNATWVDAHYRADRFQSDPSGETINLKGNRTPYAPQWLASGALTVETPFGAGLRLTGNYVGRQFTDERNTVLPSPDGRTGQLAAYCTLDATAFYEIPKWKTSFNVAVKNLSDERYVASRRPQGIRVGLPRLVTAGLDIRF
ncbi:MAG: TonB-dependent receptor [Ferruginibacter sp.]|nr:TonB-dependent receptor [Cytophagales bacterium]